MTEPGDILKQYWGYERFRPLQEEIIHAVLDGRDTLALLPTGGGKSICFQVTGLCLDGLCLVISPLIALMRDQVEQLLKRGVKAAAIYSGMSRREIDILLNNCIYGGTRFLYVSPERLCTDLFKARLPEMNVSLLAVDEAHCISQWGYDFRPPYLRIAEVYELLPDVRKIALTATATPEVSEDICQRLKFDKPAVFSKSFARKNLSYSVFEIENKEHKALDILKSVPGSAVIYVRSRRETSRIAKNLLRVGISADHYHAGLSAKEREHRQANWINNKTRVMVATNAFGMGIDKPDVRVVIHLEVPDTLEAYYQEAGRAGRDEKSAFAVLLYHKSDLIRMKEVFDRSFPSIEFIKRVYQALSNHYKLAVGSSQWQSFDFELEKFVHAYNLNAFDTYHALRKLEEEGLILLNEGFHKQSAVMISISNEEMYRYTIANAAMEPIIKGLLRLYGGTLYTEFVRINEKDLAKLTRNTEQEVSRKLGFLHQNEILVYDKAKEKPQLTFLTPRLDATGFILDVKMLEQRRDTIAVKLNEMMAYADNTSVCRTTLFQKYFGEQDYLDCGVCDVCIKARKSRDYGLNLDKAKRELSEVVGNEWIGLNALKELISFNDTSLLADALKSMVDEDKLQLNNRNEVMRK